MDDELKPVPPSKRWGQMPRHYHPDDAEIISSRLGMLDPGLRSQVCDAYAKAYLEAWGEEYVPHKKHNKARFAANTRLRIFIGKRFTVFNR
jgi:hypothetical protein